MLRIFFTIIIFFSTIILVAQSANSDVIDSLQVELKKNKTPKEKTDLYINICQVYFSLSDIDLMKTYADSAYVIAEKNNFKSEMATALMAKGIYHLHLSEFDKSLRYFKEVQNVTDSTKLVVKSLINTILVYNKIEEHQKSVETSMKMLELVEGKDGYEIEKAACYNALGVGYSVMKNHKESLKYFELSLKISEKINNTRFIIGALNNMCSDYVELEEYENAMEYCNRCLEINKDFQDVYIKGATLINIGISLLKTGKIDESISTLENAKKIVEEIKNNDLIMTSHQNLAAAYAEKGDFEKSYREQAIYLEFKEKYLNEGKEAIKQDLTDESNKKTEIINSQEESIVQLGTRKNKIILISILLVFLLSGLLFLFIKKKKLAEFEKERLKVDYVILNEENSELKTRLLNLAENKLSDYKSEKHAHSQPKYKNSSLTNEKRDEYMQLILDHMNTKKPYLDFEVNQLELAATLLMSTHHFSEVLSICFEKNFYSFINIYRVDEAKKIIKNPKYEDYKILAIGYEAGFKSKTSFNRVFKEMVGLTPSEYKEKHAKVAT